MLIKDLIVLTFRENFQMFLQKFVGSIRHGQGRELIKDMKYDASDFKKIKVSQVFPRVSVLVPSFGKSS